MRCWRLWLRPATMSRLRVRWTTCGGWLSECSPRCGVRPMPNARPTPGLRLTPEKYEQLRGLAEAVEHGTARFITYEADLAARAFREIERLRSEMERLQGALNISPDDVGRIMHESWSRTKRSQGFHHPSECPNGRWVETARG